MAEKRKGKLRKFLKSVLSLILSLLVMAVVYVGVVLLQSPGDTERDSFVVQEEPEEVTRMQTGQVSDPQALARMFGAALPMLPGYSVTGQGGNTTHDGAVARLVSLQYNGFTVSAVRPPQAAPLLLQEDLSVSLRGDVTVLNLPAVLSCRGDAYCVYFSNESAAYALYAPSAQEEDFLSLLERLAWALPAP